VAQEEAVADAGLELASRPRAPVDFRAPSLCPRGAAGPRSPHLSRRRAPRP
jgi:hypothetical protein